MIHEKLSIPNAFKEKIEIKDIEYLQNGLIYIYVCFKTKITPCERGTLLLDLEDEMCKKNCQVRVWHIPLGDKNSLRNLRGIKINY